MFNHTTQAWSTLSTESYSTFDLPGCALLPDGKVVLAGTTNSVDRMKYAVYDIVAKQWIFSGTQTYYLESPALVKLGNRLFIIQGTSPPLNVIQEINSNDYSMMPAPPERLSVIRLAGPAAIAVPARLFRKRSPSCTGV